jgi:zinc-ribbon domain
MYCSECGASVSDSAKYCLKCGKPVVSIMEPDLVQTSGVQARQARLRKGKNEGGVGLRVAITMIGIVFMIIVAFQSCAGAVGGSLTNNEQMSQGGAVGALISFLFLLGAAFAIALPTFSLVLFSVAGILGLSSGATTPFKDLTVWGILAFLLAV